jgi:hypothetical protein
MLSVELAGGMLSVELVRVAVGWLWCNGMTDSMPEVELDLFDKLVVERARITWRVLLMMEIPLHGVVDFSRCRLLRGFYGALIHFLLCL